MCQRNKVVQEIIERMGKQMNDLSLFVIKIYTIFKKKINLYLFNLQYLFFQFYNYWFEPNFQKLYLKNSTSPTFLKF